MSMRKSEMSFRPTLDRDEKLVSCITGRISELQLMEVKIRSLTPNFFFEIIIFFFKIFFSLYVLYISFQGPSVDRRRSISKSSVSEFDSLVARFEPPRADFFQNAPVSPKFYIRKNCRKIHSRGKGHLMSIFLSFFEQ